MREDIPLAPHTTFRMGPTARYFIEIEQSTDIPEAFAFIREKQLPFVILGGGSNTIFTEGERYEGVVLKVDLNGFRVISEDESGATISIGAGEVWDDVVARTVELGLSGIEALSAIPGLVGGTPVQNVGAYGTEVADVLESVAAYDYVANTWVEISRSDCGFTYRDSIFKHEQRYLITDVTLSLHKSQPIVPEYPGVRDYFEKAGITEPTLKDIREAIIAIRARKLPDPKDLASVGSFFKNPIVPAEVGDRVRKEYENAVVFDLPGSKCKVGAGWLIDTLGLKGKAFGNLGLYEHNALVIVNRGGATFAELDQLIQDIQKQVKERFDIALEPEPIFV
jgi:UDP-N-acetylmuramate dehydrogenase